MKENLINWGIPALQTVLSSATVTFLLVKGILPLKFLGMIGAALAGLLLLTVAVVGIGVGIKSKVVRLLGNLLAAVICCTLIVALNYAQKVTGTLEKIADVSAHTQSSALLVRAEDPAQALADTTGYRFGVVGKEGSSVTGLTAAILEEVEKETGEEPNLSFFDSPILIAEALLHDDIDAIVFNKGFVDILDDAVSDFSEKSRILFEMEGLVEEETETESVPTDNHKSDRHKKNPDDSLINHSFTVLISGIDKSGPISVVSRSDVNILMTVNPMTHKVLLTTTPRDYFVYIPEISGEQRDKLTHAGVYGTAYSMKTLENLYGIEISDYIRINFDSLIKLVDVLGGVDVYSQYEFDVGKYHFVEGQNHLDGQAALAFSRERYAFDDGDNQRGKNQMAVLTGIIKKLQSPAILAHPGDVLDVVGMSMQTSFQFWQMSEMISWQLETGQSWQIQSQSVTGEGDMQETFSMPGVVLSVMWPNEEMVEAASENIWRLME